MELHQARCETNPSPGCEHAVPTIRAELITRTIAETNVAILNIPPPFLSGHHQLGVKESLCSSSDVDRTARPHAHRTRPLVQSHSAAARHVTMATGESREVGRVVQSAARIHGRRNGGEDTLSTVGRKGGREGGREGGRGRYCV